MERYTVIVKDGERTDGKLRPIAPSIICSCGHNHRTFEAAEKCQTNLRHGHYEGTTYVESAKWYNSIIFTHKPDSMDYPLTPDERTAEMKAQAEAEFEEMRCLRRGYKVQ